MRVFAYLSLGESGETCLTLFIVLDVFWSEVASHVRELAGLPETKTQSFQARKVLDNKARLNKQKSMQKAGKGLLSSSDPSVEHFLGRCFFCDTMRPEMITQIIRKQFFCVTDVLAIGKLTLREFLCVIGTLTENTL